ncbi:hypothetical protein FRB94_007503 [Tulasnella sp. JGI-2019a]|nr:hypothetical protein FRB93_007143 [Tulasnella sp. JGI-2019a]KAG8997672.1 hypothetical protein FRB94_007503 [Tulasnella sp. JGI-2019a]KAG9029169.1 hypothetical protein FRB95_005627 [Tulasnella sp. JGI-2019a]
MPVNQNTFYTGRLRLSGSDKAQPEKQAEVPILNQTGLAIGLNYLDFEPEKNLRAKAYADNMTPSSAKIHIDTWWDSIFNAGGCTWLEVGKNDRDFQFGVFSTFEDHPRNDFKSKTSREISFDKPFADPPKIVCWFNSVDVGSNGPCRIKTYAENITRTGFTLCITAWDGTALYEAKTTWIAHPADRSNITSGAYDTKEVCRENAPQARYERDILFDRNFRKAPLVLTALNMLDFDKGTPIKVKTLCTNVTERSMTWHLDTWNQTIRYSAGASYLAIQDY